MAEYFERRRPREQMARTIVEDFKDGDFARLFFALKLERITVSSKGDTSSQYYALLTKSLRAMQMKDYASLRRAMTELEENYAEQEPETVLEES